jgi:DNA-binding transcriptional MerR regulator
MQNPSSQRLAYSRKEAADLLNISTASLDRLVRRGLIRPSRALRRPLYTRAELERFLRESAPEL